MDTLKAQAPDGHTLTIQIPDGTDPKQYGAMVDDVMSHYKSEVLDSSTNMATILHKGPIAAGLEGFVNNMPMLPQVGAALKALTGHGDYSSNLAAHNQAIVEKKAQHPVAYGAGAVTGALAPGLLPGVGPAIAANPMTAGAILGGTNAISNSDLTKDPGQNVMDAVKGAGVGALTSGLISKILPSSATLESKANTLANRSVNMPKNVLSDMTEAERQAQGSALRQAGVVAKDKQVAFDQAESVLKDYGQKIGSIADKTEGQGLVADPEAHYQTVSDLLKKAQGFAGLENKVSKALGRDYKAGATDIANLPDNPSWSAIQSLKEKYGKFAFKENATKGAKDTYFALSNMLKGIADKAQADPALGPQYKQALAGYSRMAPVVDGLQDALDSELRGTGAGIGARGLAGLVRKIPGPVRAVVGPLALLHGNYPIALAAALPEMMNPAIQSNVAGAMAKAMPAIQNLATQGATKAATNQNVQEMIKQLKQKFADRNKF